MNSELNLTYLNQAIENIMKIKPSNEMVAYFPMDPIMSIATMNVDSAPNFWNDDKEPWKDITYEDITKMHESMKGFECPDFELFKKISDSQDYVMKIHNDNIKILQGYGESIIALQAIIDNVDDLANDTDVLYTRLDGSRGVLKPYQGLCNNCMFGNLDEKYVNEMFSSWKQYSGMILYPVGGRSEFYNRRNVYINPKRIDLAKHCLKYLQDTVSDYSILIK